MTVVTKNLFIVGAKRTPFGSFGGSLKKWSATDLAVHASQAALPPHLKDRTQEVFVGNVIQSSKDAAYLARHVGLRCEIPLEVPALTINRLCGSGFETLRLGIQVLEHQNGVVLAAGTENMSNAPMAVEGTHVRWGVPLGTDVKMYDSLWSGLTDSLYSTPMGVTAENLATRYNITREECDEYALQSQQKWKEAHDAGIFQHEMAPVEITTKKGPQLLDTDEHPRPTASIEQMAKLPPVFQKEGRVTAANASGICDGAGAVVLATEDVAADAKPMARVVATAVTGCEPTEMGIGPVSAIRKILEATKLSLSDMDRIEINEAFAAQVLACAKELDLDRSKLNIHGGAIALGHPLGASGSRILAHLAHGFTQNPQHKYYIGAACIGGGQGIAVLLENV